jgi:hypothetical protein
VQVKSGDGFDSVREAPVTLDIVSSGLDKVIMIDKQKLPAGVLDVPTPEIVAEYKLNTTQLKDTGLQKFEIAALRKGTQYGKVYRHVRIVPSENERIMVSL